MEWADADRLCAEVEARHGPEQDGQGGQPPAGRAAVSARCRHAPVRTSQGLGLPAEIAHHIAQMQSAFGDRAIPSEAAPCQDRMNDENGSTTPWHARRRIVFVTLVFGFVMAHLAGQHPKVGDSGTLKEAPVRRRKKDHGRAEALLIAGWASGGIPEPQVSHCGKRSHP